jgi:hypothetical protein
MRWRMEFYNERRGILARYGIEAPLPAAAVQLGRSAVQAEYPSTPRASRSLFERAERVGGQDASGWVLYRIGNLALVLALTLLVSLAATRTADGQVPTAIDFAACNEEGPRAVKAGSATPTTRDHVRADSARGGGGAITTSYTDFTDQVIASSDPQIHGMKAEGARTATYQAAYRSCMRRKGF